VANQKLRHEELLAARHSRFSGKSVKEYINDQLGVPGKSSLITDESFEEAREQCAGIRNGTLVMLDGVVYTREEYSEKVKAERRERRRAKRRRRTERRMMTDSPSYSDSGRTMADKSNAQGNRLPIGHSQSRSYIEFEIVSILSQTDKSYYVMFNRNTSAYIAKSQSIYDMNKPNRIKIKPWLVHKAELVVRASKQIINPVTDSPTVVEKHKLKQEPKERWEKQRRSKRKIDI